MDLKIVRNDGRILVFEQKNPGFLWGVLASVLAIAVVGAALYASPLTIDLFNPYHVSPLVAIALAFMGAITWIPFRESMTLDRDTQTLVIVRKKLTGTTRKEMRFQDARAVGFKFNGHSYHLSLETDNRKIRFPIVSVPIPVEKPDFVDHGEECAAALRAALGLPAADPSQTAALSSGRLIRCSLRVLQRDSDALVMEDNAPSILAAPLVLFVLIMGVMLALNWFDSLPWGRTWIVGVTSAVFGLAFTLFYPYRSQYVFDRIGRRLLLLRKCVYRTTCKETSYDQILATEILLVKPPKNNARYFLHLITTGIWKIDLTPTVYPDNVAAQYRNCVIIERMVKEALGLDQPERGEPQPDVELEPDAVSAS